MRLHPLCHMKFSHALPYVQSIPGNFPFPIMPNTGYSNITEGEPRCGACPNSTLGHRLLACMPSVTPACYVAPRCAACSAGRRCLPEQRVPLALLVCSPHMDCAPHLRLVRQAGLPAALRAPRRLPVLP